MGPNFGNLNQSTPNVGMAGGMNNAGNAPMMGAPMANAPVMNAQPVGAQATGAAAGASVKRGGSKAWIVVAIVAILLAVGGIAFGVLQLMNNQQLNDEITQLKEENVALREQLSKLQEAVGDKNPAESEGDASQTGNGVAYLEPADWNVKFAYPEGVTDVKYTMQDTPWDGLLTIVSVTKDGMVYDVDTFGGSDSYAHYPFFLGEVARWNVAAPSDEWSGMITTMSLGFTNGDYQYYIGGGNGYEAGSEADYEGACRIVAELLNNIEAR